MESRESSLMNGHGLVNGDAAGHKRKGVASEVPLPKPLLEKPALHPLSLDGVDMATVPEVRDEHCVPAPADKPQRDAAVPNCIHLHIRILITCSISCLIRYFAVAVV
eukprot:scaffold1466_cov249-Pinguiococcus_pyrenoidosus.AAC.10